MVGNTDKGIAALISAFKEMFGHELAMQDVIRYQGPMRKHIPMNPHREEFMQELENPDITIGEINEKWAKKPTLRLLFSKYIWGNQQKVRLWSIKRILSKK